MGFASGFAEGFAENFGPAYLKSADADAKLEAEVQSTLLTTFQKRKEEFVKAQTTDAGYIRTAKQMTSEFGLPAPAVDWVYTGLRQGRTIESIRTDIETGKFVDPTTKKAPTAAAPTSTDTQMADAGLSPSQEFPITRGGTTPATAAKPAEAPTAYTGVQIEDIATKAIPGVVVTSRQRSPEKNAAVGGVANSYHLTDQARDFVPPKGVSMGELHAQLKATYGPAYQVINEGDHVHVEPARGGSRGEPTTVESVEVVAPKPDKPVRLAQNDRLGWDATGRATRRVIDAAGGEEAYNQVLNGYQPQERTSTLQFQPGARKTTPYTTEQYLSLAVLAESEGRVEDAKSYRQQYEIMKTAQMEAKSWEDRQLIELVIPDGKGGAKFTTGYSVPTPTGLRLVDSTTGGAVEPGARPVGQNELQAREKVMTSRESSISNYNTNLSAVAETIPLVGDIFSIVERDPRVLTKVSGVVATVTGFATEVNTAFNVIGKGLASKGAKPGGPEVFMTEAEIEGQLRLNGVIGKTETLEELASRTLSFGTDAKSLAEDRRIFQAKVLLAAVRLGAMEGQSGQGLSNKDFDRFLTMIGAGTTDPKTFMTNMTQYVQGKVDTINGQARILNNPNTGLAGQFRQQYGYVPGQTVLNVDEMMKEQGGKTEAAYRRIVGGPAGGQRPANSVSVGGRTVPASIMVGGKEAKIMSLTGKDGKTTYSTTPDGRVLYKGADGKMYTGGKE